MSDQAIEQSQPSVEDRMLALVSEEPLKKEAEEGQQETAPQENEQETEEAQAEESESQDEEQPEAEEQEAVEAELVEIDVDGETYQVPEVLKDKFMLQADYTRKTQEVAEQRKQVELAQAQLQQAAQLQQESLAEYAQLIALDNQLQQYQQIDWNALYENDPAEFVRLKEQARDLRDSRQGLSNTITEKQQQQFAQQNQARIQIIEEGKKTLAKEIPNWNTELAKTLNQYAVDKFGFTPDEVNAVIDPRVVKLLHTAYQRDKQVTNKPITDKRVANLPKVSKPGGNNKPSAIQSREADARKALKKTGSMDAAQALFLARYSNT